jgi:hypothetical protein
VTDYLSALRLYLMHDAAVMNVLDVTFGDVFVLGIPSKEEFVKAMPLRCAVIVPVPSRSVKGIGFTTRASCDIVCYGESDFQAAVLERAVSEALKMLSREVVGGVLLHNCTLAGGPTQARDPETLWPAMRRQFEIRADEREIGTS